MNLSDCNWSQNQKKYPFSEVRIRVGWTEFRNCSRWVKGKAKIRRLLFMDIGHCTSNSPVTAASRFEGLVVLPGWILDLLLKKCLHAHPSFVNKPLILVTLIKNANSIFVVMKCHKNNKRKVYHPSSPQIHPPHTHKTSLGIFFFLHQVTHDILSGGSWQFGKSI